MENLLFKSLTGCSVAEKAEFIQTLAQELFAAPGSADPILVRTATGAVVGYLVPADLGKEVEIDLNAGVAELPDPDSLVPIEIVFAESFRPTC